MTKPRIGFIGLGLMGAAMVERLQSLGYELTVIANRSRKAIDGAVARGATEAKTSAELAAASDIVMFCMDTSASVESRVYGEDGVLAGVKEGSLVVHVDDVRTDVVEEAVIVAHDDDAALEVLKEGLEPANGQDVEVVGGLVEQQHIWQ